MKLPITCLCGQTMRLSTRLDGKPIACPKCGVANTLRLPVAGIPPSAEPLLPSWIIAPILAYLTIASGVIVLGGWWLAQPPARAPRVRASAAKIDPPLVEIKPTVVADPSPEWRGEEKTPANESFVLPRRRPSSAKEPEKLRAESLPSAEDQQPRLKSPLLWKLDKPNKKRNEINLITPVEIAQGEIGNLHYSLRRLTSEGAVPKPLKLAVTPIVHDDLASILKRMGKGYHFTNLRKQDLFAYPALRNHDVIFLTCADVYPQDLQSVRPLRMFVEAGGTLYASDLRGDIILAAFPEFRARAPMLPGVPQNVEANVVDRGLESHLGRKTIPLTFDAPDWRPAAFDPTKVTVCLQGAYRNQLGQTQVAPLLVKFRVKQGTVIFTSFHHAKNDSEIVQKVLDYLVFASVNARSEARVRELMQRYDLAPQNLRPVLLSADKKSAAIHHHPGGGLQIALGFEHQGAKLKLTLRSPAGQTIEHEDQGIYLIEIPNAPPGVWQYTVTPLELPHANFPILVAVGTLKS